MVRTAILVDGGFYRKRANYLWKKKTAKDRAKELYSYCQAHLEDEHQKRSLYRIFYYDCPPIEKEIYHPLLKKNIKLEETELFAWSNEFLEELKKKRKVALRLGELSGYSASYSLKPELTRRLLSGEMTVSDITNRDLTLDIKQKGVDMKIGLDIASLSYKKQVDQIILIAGDSDFVPAAKLARREGIDFILDPMWATIKPNLYEHIDGLQSQWGKPDKKQL